MARRLTHCALPVLVAAVALVLRGAGPATSSGGSPLGPLGTAGSDSAYWYYCPPGLVQTGSADALAKGRYCAFW